MKKVISLFTVLFVIILIVGFAMNNIGDPNADLAPVVDNSINSGYTAQPDTTTPSGFPYPELFNFYYAGVPGMNAGTVGALYFNGKYYFNRWNTNYKVYRYDNTGTNGGPGTLVDSLSYVGQCRDLATDGTYIYGGNASTTVYRFDPNTMATLKTFTLSGGAARGLAWDPNRKGFWNCNFSGNIFFHDTTGTLKITLTNTLTGKYGLAFDSSSVDGSAFIWVWNQESTTANVLYKYLLPAGTLVTSYSFTLPATSTGTSGGVEVVKNTDINKVVLLLNYQNVALVGYNLRTLTSTSLWTEQTSGISTALYSVSAVDDNIAWACGASGKVLRTTNKGVNWTNVIGNLPTAYAMYCIFAWDANTAVVTGVSSSTTAIYQTSNGGTNWTTANSHSGFGDNLYMSSATNAYFIGDPISGYWDLLSSTNAGLNWSTWSSLATTNTSGTYNNAACFNGQQIWFCSNGDSKVNYTSNMGVNWSQQTSSLSELTAIWFNSSTAGLAAGSSTSPGMLITTNSGTNWSTLTQSFVGTSSIAAITGTGNSYWVAKQDSTIYYSSNNGTNWTLQYTRPYSSTAGVFYHMTKSRSGETLWAVRSTGGISRYGSPITGINTISTEVPSSYSLKQNYPNPFNPVTRINFSLPKSGLATLKVYDILGKRVATLVNEVKNVGTFSVDFNGAELASGIYFYRLESNGFTDVKKMMLIK
jgi:photosystem II stability/assembly factor-like uncharacterized protein